MAVILIIDDSPTELHLFQKMLTKNGFETLVADSGEEGLRRTRLAIGGREVMEILGVGPGPLVGRALRYLARRVEEKPDCNREDELRELLQGWRETER